MDEVGGGRVRFDWVSIRSTANGVAMQTALGMAVDYLVVVVVVERTRTRERAERDQSRVAELSGLTEDGRL